MGRKPGSKNKATEQGVKEPMDIKKAEMIVEQATSDTGYIEPNKEKMKAVLEAMKQMDSKYGKGTVIKLGDRVAIKTEVIPTGAMSLDIALGVGGLPKGRIIELFGPESCGKSTLAMQIIAEAQKLGGICAYIDAENAMDKEYAAKIGVDVDNLLLSQPDWGEQGLEIAENFVRSGGVDVIVVDSVAALLPKQELDGEIGDSVIGETPIFIRKNKKYISIVSIASLYGGTYNFFGKRYINRYKKLKSIEILTSTGWKNAKCIALKQNKDKKKIILTNTLNGIAMTTKDHSLFIGGEEKSPSELKVGDKIDIKKPEFLNILNTCNEDIAWIIGYYCAEGNKNTRMQNVFSVYSIEEKYINLCDKKLKENFTVYTNKTLNETPKDNRQPLYTLYISGDELLTSYLKQCFDEKIKQKRIPDCILNGNVNIKKAFLEGYKAGDGVKKRKLYSFATSSTLLLAGVTYIFDCLGYKYHINSTYRPEKNCIPEFAITQVDNNIKDILEITKFIEIKAPEFLYDIETEDGTFAAGAGYILHHNSFMGLQARMMSQAMRKLTAIVNKSKTIMIFINQIREKIGVMWGPKETTPGGRALKFYSSVRIDIRRKEPIKEGERILGNHILAKVVKNKVAAPFCTAEFDIIFGKGVDKESAILGAAEACGVVTKTGSWYNYGNTKIGQGQAGAVAFLNLHRDILEKIGKETMAKSVVLIEVKGAEEEVPEMPEIDIEEKVDEEKI